MKVELIDHMGDDLRVVNSARVSFNKQSKWVQKKLDLSKKYPATIGPEFEARFEPYENEPLWADEEGNELSGFILSEKDQKLTKYLVSHGHFSPFTHCVVTLRETVPIFVARQRFKHVVGFSYNEVSRRYVDDEPKFYEPDKWRKKAENKKQGSSDEEITELNYSQGFAKRKVSEAYISLLSHAELLYNDMLEAGVAPEQARMVLPQSMYTSYYVTGSLYAFARAYNLRSKEDAQKEIRDLAEMWDPIMKELYPVSWEMLTNNAP